MAALQRTPGPWAIELWGEEFPSSATVYSEALRPGVGTVAYITPNGMRENTAIADARLMAAAPDLLDALRGMVLNACSACDENYVIRCTKAEWEAHVAATNRAIAAIAKAEDAA